MELIKQVLEPLGITTLEKENYEADDIIATLSTAAEPLGFETLIVTGDRDFVSAGEWHNHGALPYARCEHVATGLPRMRWRRSTG